MIGDDELNRLLIIGNGFDLACNLESSYDGFFNYRFHQLFWEKGFNHVYDKITSVLESESSIFQERPFPIRNSVIQELKSDLLGDPNLWDIFFILAKKNLSNGGGSKWSDVESTIFGIISIVLVNDRANTLFSFKSKISESNFIKYIKWLSYYSDGTKEKVAQFLLNELKKFEEVFATYISSLVANNIYKDNAKTLLKELCRVSDPQDPDKTENLNVISFNYSLNELFGIQFSSEVERVNSNFRLDSWSNVHGVANFNDGRTKSQINIKHHIAQSHELPRPIFGIDGYDRNNNKMIQDDRLIFTKSYRVIDNKISSIRNFDNFLLDLPNIDVITIMGHSLDAADYSYFETIFDRCNLSSDESSVKIEFYYYEGNDIKNESKNIFRQKALQKVIRLLNSYGESLNVEHGYNLVSKLNFEGRFAFRPNPRLSMREINYESYGAN